MTNVLLQTTPLVSIQSDIGSNTAVIQTGSQGPQGIQGIQGVQGNQGNPGVQGQQGNIGPVGPLVWQPVPTPWASNTFYTSIPPASLVYFNQSAYVCNTTHTSGLSFDATKFTLIVSTNTFAGSVRDDIAQSLTTNDVVGTPSQTTQARENIYAAPFDAMSYNGCQTNGAQEVSQFSGASVVAIPNSAVATWVTDGWYVRAIGCTVNAQQVTDAPPGFSNSLKISVTTADPSPSAGDSLTFEHPIEAYRTAKFAMGTGNAMPIAIAFWYKAHRTGTYSGSVRSTSGARSWIFSFTYSVADTWQYITLNIPGDTGGSWTTSISVGMYIDIAAMCQSGFGVSPPWWSNDYLGAGQGSTTNGAATTSDYHQITGLIVLPGIELPSATRSALIKRPFDEEIMLAQRYFWVWGPGAAFGQRLCLAYADTTTNLQCVLYLPCSMRNAPSITLQNLAGNGIVLTAGTVQTAFNNAIHFNLTGSSWTANTVVQVYANTGSTGLFFLDSRLPSFA